MGYYGMPSAKLPPGPKTPLEEALYQIQNLESLEILSKLLYNAATCPKEEKYRKIRLTNAKINSLIVEVPGCLETLRELGWESDPADADSLMIAAGKYMTMAQVRMLEDAKDRVRKEQRSATSAVQSSANTAAVRVQA
mmetsp:Transcript_5475/g.12111  ORF Transcript_5475/g.12111 Transcript_5475/m.12111 type:complete len:138 (+) Transcript_5475:118-531(+)|eukprot:CAMPEP_0202890908 /NCGR_PEP_ID=MMETSP1392-20130828/1159_1 /ASSEMBLY_ACC=CAM_ASM_000868 /TAXON_ID=225041 /ORGANISM="Chlamydomonas chlamydogama, Strain SAG 11-48b" /LENGTH=137 /DNA_ID=CAMNT_0049574559 /DNA_START=122 /DNA_END=535 /DNA_ORIENTATION=-